MDLATLRDEARIRYGVDDTEGFYDDTTLNLLINAAIRKYNAEMDWPWNQKTTTVNTVADSSTLTLDGNLRRVARMSHEGRSITYTNSRNIPDYAGSTGTPRKYTFEGDTWLVLPASSGVYTIDYTYYIGNDTLVNDSDEPSTPDWAIDPITSYTCVMMARRSRNLDLEGRFFGEYSRTLDSLIDESRKSVEGMLPRNTRGIYLIGKGSYGI